MGFNSVFKGLKLRKPDL